MIRKLSLIALLGLAASAQNAKKSALDKATLEAYVRHLFVMDSRVTVQVSDPKPSEAPGFVQETVTEIYAADFADYELDDKGNKIQKDEIQSITIAVIPTDKTRIMNEISKGCAHGNFDTNATLVQEKRRIPFKRMIYVGDGVSDIHAFETVRRDGGHAVAVYNPAEPQFDQAEMLRSNGWVDLIATADFRPGASAHDWVLQKVRRIRDGIKKEEVAAREAELDQVRKVAPKYIHAWTKED